MGDITNRYRRLVAQHKSLDREIDKMESSGHFDEEQLKELKKRKLALRDEIHNLRNSSNKDTPNTLLWG